MIISPMKVTLIDSMGSDLSIVNAARVSFHKEHNEIQDNDPKLIAYLAKHGHWTPFAHAFLSFRIKAPIFVARQLVKHQVGLAWNEVSRRYVDDEPEFYWPEWRGKAENVKQGSSAGKYEPAYQQVDLVESAGLIEPSFDEFARWHINESLSLYKGAMLKGIAPEQARMVLPQNTMTEWIWSGSLAAFARVVRLRLDPHAQAETREVAEQIAAQVPSGFEHSWKALLA